MTQKYNNFRSKLWVNSLSEEKELNYLKDLPLKELKLKYVCEFHFEENCFTSTIRNRIGKFAVPTLMGYKDNSKSDSQVENILITDDHLDENTLLIHFKQYDLELGGLKYPTNALITSVNQLAVIFNKYVDTCFNKTGVRRILFEKMSVVNFDWLEHEGLNHSHIHKSVVINSFIKVMILHKIKLVNSNLKREKKKKLQHLVNL